MEKLTFDFIKNNIPNLGFGIMRVPLIDKGSEQNIDMNHFRKMVDYYMENDMNYFDTAYMYHGGNSETAVRKAVTSKYSRKDFFLADKLPIWYAKEKSDIQKIFDEQLERCGVDYFDFYLLHSLNISNIKQAEEMGAYEFMKNLKKEGKARFIGFSFHDTPDVLEEFLSNHPEMEFVQLQINYLDWNDEMRSDEYYRIARKYNMPIIIMEPVRGGSLANMPEEIGSIFKEYNPNMSIASWAIRFCASLDGVMTVLSGMSSMEQMMDNIPYMKSLTKLNENEYKAIDKAVKKFKELAMAPCTSCKYCVDCPSEINIAEMFSIFNSYKLSNDIEAAKNKYSHIEDAKKAGKCIECGKCEGVCPQHINIIERLKDISKKFTAF